MLYLKYIFINTSYSYNKYSKLKSRKLVDNLFTNGKSTLAFPVKIVFATEKVDQPLVLSGIGVSKKYFKKAHDRNFIKRLLRETYRLQQSTLIDFAINHHLQIHFFMLYVSRDLPVFEALNLQMTSIIKKFMKQLPNETTA